MLPGRGEVGSNHDMDLTYQAKDRSIHDHVVLLTKVRESHVAKRDPTALEYHVPLRCCLIFSKKIPADKAKKRFGRVNGDPWSIYWR